jgi:hypothetical protein
MCCRCAGHWLEKSPRGRYRISDMLVYVPADMVEMVMRAVDLKISRNLRPAAFHDLGDWVPARRLRLWCSYKQGSHRVQNTPTVYIQSILVFSRTALVLLHTFRALFSLTAPGAALTIVCRCCRYNYTRQPANTAMMAHPLYFITGRAVGDCCQPRVCAGPYLNSVEWDHNGSAVWAHELQTVAPATARLAPTYRSFAYEPYGPRSTRLPTGMGSGCANTNESAPADVCIARAVRENPRAASASPSASLSPAAIKLVRTVREAGVALRNRKE